MFQLIIFLVAGVGFELTKPSIEHGGPVLVFKEENWSAPRAGFQLPTQPLCPTIGLIGCVVS